MEQLRRVLDSGKVHVDCKDKVSVEQLCRVLDSGKVHVDCKDKVRLSYICMIKYTAFKVLFPE